MPVLEKLAILFYIENVRSEIHNYYFYYSENVSKIYLENYRKSNARSFLFSF